MKSGKTIDTALLIGSLLVVLSGCQKQEGPAEQAGRKIDEAVSKVGAQVEKAGDKLQDAAKGEK